MKLTLVLNCQDRYLKLQEVHAFAAGDVYNPLVLDFADLPPDRLSTVDPGSLSITLSHDGAVVASAVGFAPVDGHRRLFRAALPLVSSAFGEWSSAVESPLQTVHCEVSDRRNGVYVSCEVPVILRRVSVTGTDVTYYTASEVDALLVRNRDEIDAILATKQDALTVSGALGLRDGALTVSVAHGTSPGVVSSSTDSTDTAGMSPCVVVNGVPYYKDYETTEYGPAGFNVYGLVKSLHQDTGMPSTSWRPCPVIQGVPFYIPAGLASSTQPGLVTTTSEVASTDGLAPCPIIDAVPYYAPPKEYPLANGASAGLVKGGFNLPADARSGYYSCPVDDGVPYYRYPDLANYPKEGLIRTPYSFTDPTGWSPCPVKDGIAYYMNTDTTYGPASRQSLGLVRTDSFVDAIRSDSGYLPCPIVDGVVYYRNTTYPVASTNVSGVVKTTSDVTAVADHTPCPIVDGVVYYRNTTYPVASTNVSGVVKTTSDVTDVTDYRPCPIVDGVPYYRGTGVDIGAAAYGVFGLVKTSNPLKSIAGLAGFGACPIVDGVPYYRNIDTTYGAAALNVFGLVKTTSLVGSPAGYTACPIIEGVPYYRNTVYGDAAKDTPGLVKTTSDVTDVAGYEPCPIVDGVPYYARPAATLDLSYVVRTTSSASLQDRAMNRVLMATEDDVQLVFPPAMPGRARDFILLVVVPNGTMPVGQVLAPPGVSCYWAQGEAPFANDLDRDELDTIYYQFFFTEFDTDVFRVSRVRLVNS